MAILWKDLVRREIWALVGERGSELLRRQELLDRGLARFRAAFPSAQTPEQTMSRVLQELRDMGELEFVQPGLYRVLVQSERELDEVQEARANPIPRSGEANVIQGTMRVRRYQTWLRSLVLPNFGLACAVCGLIPEWFLEAAHLRPASRLPDIAGNPGAAVALCRNHHAALDAGALTINRDLTMSIYKAAHLEKNEQFKRTLAAFDGQPIRKPIHFELLPAALPSMPAHDRMAGSE